MQGIAAFHAYRRKRRSATRKWIVYLGGISLIAGILAAYASIATSHAPDGPPPGFHIVSASWSGSMASARASQQIELALTNGEDHPVRLLELDLVPSAPLHVRGLSLRGRIRTSSWSTVHEAPGPWFQWRYGSRLQMGRGWTLQPGVGLTIQGTVSFTGSRLTRTRKAPAVPALAGLRLRYETHSALHEEIVSLPGVQDSR